MNEQDELFDAYKRGDLEKAGLLISKGVNVSEKDNDGYTPLHWASWGCHLKIVELLISYGADYLELMEEYEGNEEKREELERIVIDIGMSRVKMI